MSSSSLALDSKLVTEKSTSEKDGKENMVVSKFLSAISSCDTAAKLSKAIVQNIFGEPSRVLLTQHILRPRPQAGELIVRMKLSSINPSDLITIRGTYRDKIKLPYIPGYEGVGHVIAHGENVVSPPIGTRVLGLRGMGTWQEYTAIPAEEAVAVPDAIDDITASQLYVNPLTAWVMLKEELRVGRGDTLAVNACGSAFGQIIAKFAPIFGYTVIGIVRSHFHTKRLAEMGVNVIDTSNPSQQFIHEVIMKHTHGRGVTAALDAVGGKAGAELATCVQSGGSMLHYGLLSGEPLSEEVFFNARQRRVQIKLFWLRDWVFQREIQYRKKVFNEMMEVFVNHRINLPASACFDLENIHSAVKMSEESNRIGKVVLRCSSQ